MVCLFGSRGFFFSAEVFIPFQVGNLGSLYYSGVGISQSNVKLSHCFIIFINYYYHFPPLSPFLHQHQSVSQGYLHFSAVTSSADLEKSMLPLSRTPHGLTTAMGNSHALAFQFNHFLLLITMLEILFTPDILGICHSCLPLES